MEITKRTVGKCKVLDCSGSIYLGPATAALREAIREAVQDEASKVVLNLANVTSMDSCGLGELISGYVHVTNNGGKLVLLNIPERIEMLIGRMRLKIVLDVYDDEQKALEGCE